MGKLPKAFPCNKCPLVLTTKQNLHRHMVLHQQLIPRVVCKVCSQTVANKSNLRIHYERHHMKRRLPKKPRLTSEPSQYPYRMKTKINSPVPDESDSQNENDENIDSGFDDGDVDATSLVEDSNPDVQLPNGSEIVTVDMPISDPVLAARFLAQLHATHANFPRPVMSNDDDEPLFGFEPVDNAPLNLIWKPENKSDDNLG